ncbi:hypothetical protein J7E71_21310 [Mesobacillus foraminis]|uniref:methionyl-tRNA formyltransferase n=1 Tax=Mesobacillus foraminis TaxID=279826 RepID=UPI001BEB1B27|nr:formyltransferase family protein [Mesobacillus foraminis]MBT2758412.1 hypothetical protein [Mesobacillus foraminis]
MITDKKKLNILLLGKKSWAAKALNYLIEREHNVVTVVAKDPCDELDRVNGTLHEAAHQHNIPVLNMKELNNEIIKNKLNNVDLVISYLFWMKVKEPLLSLGKLGAINFHPAPLPEYKGLGGYNAAILDNKTEYGVTAHFMNELIDEGPIIKCKRFNIDQINETAFSLERKSQEAMFELFKEVISDFENDMVLVEETPKEKGVYINRTKFEEMKLINPNDPTEIIERKIRAFWFPPFEGAKLKVGEKYYTLIDNNLLKEISHRLN